MSLQETSFFDLAPELAKTRVMLERIPADKFDWSPHEKSWELIRLARHIVNLPTWVGITMNTDGLDFAVPPPPRPVSATVAELLQEFDDNCTAAKAALAAASDEDFEAMWSLSNGDHVIFTQSKREVIREWAINHMIHHRAQLSIYFRLVGVPLPPLYGPSADES